MSDTVTVRYDLLVADSRDMAKEMMPLVYDELRRLAHRWMAAEPADHTLEPTALVHEAFLNLLGDREWKDQGHFFSSAALAMRRILVDRARRYRQLKRGAGRKPLALDSGVIVVAEEAEELLRLDEGLKELEKLDERRAKVVMLRYFAGLSVEDTAVILDVSPRTIKREWRQARAWLYDEIGHGE